jgi:hypothetical protein
VIGRLGSGDPELEHAAQNFLRTIAGRDYGPDAASWRAWWRDPPRRLLGIASVGHTTLRVALPATLALVGVGALAFGRWRHRLSLVGAGQALLSFAWVTGGSFLLIHLFNPNFFTCTFGAGPIAYFTGQGTVVGLEDAQVSGAAYPFIGLAALMLGTGAIGGACTAVDRREAPGPGVPASSAPVR